MREASTRMLEQGTQAPSPAPDLIPAKNEPRTNIGIGAADGGTSVARHMVIHIDASRAENRVRRELFSTNREAFKEGPILEGLLLVLTRMLQEDQNLYAIERELTEK